MPLPLRQPRLHSRGPHHADARTAAADVARHWLRRAYRTEAVRRTGAILARGGNRWAPRAPSMAQLLPDAYEVVRLCRALGRDPAAHVEACFDVLENRRPPALRQIAADGLAKQRGWDAALAGALAQARFVREVIPARDSGALSPVAEQIKAQYAADREVCRALVGETLGYHPGSAHCSACPEAAGCREDVARFFGPDALRRRAGA